MSKNDNEEWTTEKALKAFASHRFRGINVKTKESMRSILDKLNLTKDQLKKLNLLEKSILKWEQNQLIASEMSTFTDPENYPLLKGQFIIEADTCPLCVEYNIGLTNNKICLECPIYQMNSNHRVCRGTPYMTVSRFMLSPIPNWEGVHSASKAEVVFLNRVKKELILSYESPPHVRNSKNTPITLYNSNCVPVLSLDCDEENESMVEVRDVKDGMIIGELEVDMCSTEYLDCIDNILPSDSEFAQIKDWDKAIEKEKKQLLTFSLIAPNLWTDTDTERFSIYAFEKTNGKTGVKYMAYNIFDNEEQKVIGKDSKLYTFTAAAEYVNNKKW